MIEVGSIELGDDIISLLNENMDGDNNTLRIMAIYEQDIIYTDGTAVEAAFDTTLTAADGAEIELMDYVEPDVEISSNDGLLATADELDHVLENLTVSLNYKLKNYNAGKTFDTTDKSIKITLVARKTGSLKL